MRARTRTFFRPTSGSRSQDLPTAVLVLLLLALEIYIPFTLVACYTFSVVSKDVGVHVDVNRVLHGHHIYMIYV